MIAKIKAAILNMIIGLLLPKQEAGMCATSGNGNPKPDAEIPQQEQQGSLFMDGVQTSIEECEVIMQKKGAIDLLLDKLCELMTEQYKKEIAMTFDRGDVLGLMHGRESLDIIFELCNGFDAIVRQDINIKLSEFAEDSDKEKFLISSIIYFNPDMQNIENIFLEASLKFNQEMLLEITRMMKQVASGEALTYPSPHKGQKVKLLLPERVTQEKATLRDYVAPDFKMSNADVAALLNKTKGQKKN
jgi:hypothetical protein